MTIYRKKQIDYIETLLAKQLNKLNRKDKEIVALFLKDKIFDVALKDFLKKQTSLFLNNVAERSWYPHFIDEVNKQKKKFKFLKEYFTDAEYNRQQDGQIKVILDQTTSNSERKINICCDVILHGRGECGPIENILSVEFKKESNTQDEKDKDKIRLRALTATPYDNVYSADGTVFPETVCGYFLGCYVEINCQNLDVIVEYYINGKLQHEWCYALNINQL
ncbi:MAG: hypothetical protein KH844_02040 [Neisseria mucosa]|nr:hypothetical protein [Neisseria mucosa]